MPFDVVNREALLQEHRLGKEIPMGTASINAEQLDDDAA
jgi:hypothetical protein